MNRAEKRGGLDQRAQVEVVRGRPRNRHRYQREVPELLSKEFASLAETRASIEGLSSHDYTRLILIAEFFARRRTQGSIVEAEDLLHDAVLKTLDGRRRWKRSVSMLKHLDRVMESDSGHVTAGLVAH